MNRPNSTQDTCTPAPSNAASCPFATQPAQPAQPEQSEQTASTARPPGPAPGLMGWGLLRRMSRDLLGTLAQWRGEHGDAIHLDRKSTRLNSSHLVISYAVFCLKKKSKQCTCRH